MINPTQRWPFPPEMDEFLIKELGGPLLHELAKEIHSGSVPTVATEVIRRLAVELMANNLGYR